MADTKCPCKSLMIVEDDEGIRQVLKTLLDMEGYVCFIAENGHEAMAKLKILSTGHHPCLVLCDMMMPHNGWNVLSMIEETDTLVSIPIVMMSASDEAIKKLPESKKFIKKPFSMDAILDIVHRYCGASPHAVYKYKPGDAA